MALLEARQAARKAKALYDTGGLGADYAAALGADVAAPHKDYPLLNPLLQSWVFLHRGRVTHVENRLPIQLLFVALVLALASALRHHASPGIGAALLVLVLTTSQARLLPRT